MNRNVTGVTIGVLLLSMIAIAQPNSATDEGSQESIKITVRGCILSERGNYILIENRTGTIYALQGVGNNLQSFLRKEVEITAVESNTGSVETGVRPEKAGSNSDKVRGVDGVLLQLTDMDKDIRIVGKHCKAADRQSSSRASKP